MHPHGQDWNIRHDDEATPISPAWVPGAGAFVLLDYRTGHNPTHLEHSVVFLPESWESLSELIAAPQVFANRVLKSYREVNGYNVATSRADLKINDWPLAGPVTVHIEPLTSPSFQNLAVLEALSPLYPGFADLLSMPSEETLGSTIAKFRNRVIAASTMNADPTQVAAAGTAYDKEIAKLIVRDKPREDRKQDGFKTGGGSGPFGRGPRGGGSLFEPPAPQPSTFDLQYIVEFALDTRLITVRYVPRATDYATVDVAPQRYLRPVTPVTRNPVKSTRLHFLHFDLDMSDTDDYHVDMADRRAAFAMDYLENPLRLNEILKNVDIGPQPEAYMVMTDVLTNTGNVLNQKYGGRTVRPVLQWPAHRDPVLILESILPDPSAPQTVSSSPTNNPTPCVIVVIVNGEPVYIIVKNYT
ncbi:MAG: hypothetical protein JST30_15925 [Armatimonadetes bacterium]|nr:hypothetical protein [Armatimonadota bacterium]